MYKTEIVSNGSKFAGQELDTLEDLFAMLQTYALDPDFEKYGNFFHYTTGKHFEVYHFHGNFACISHVFDIRTNDPEVIDKLLNLIFDNQGNAVYQAIKFKHEIRRKLYFKNTEEMKTGMKWFKNDVHKWDKWKLWIEVSATDDDLADFFMYMDDIAFKTK